MCFSRLKIGLDVADELTLNTEKKMKLLHGQQPSGSLSTTVPLVARPARRVRRAPEIGHARVFSFTFSDTPITVLGRDPTTRPMPSAKKAIRLASLGPDLGEMGIWGPAYNHRVQPACRVSRLLSETSQDAMAFHSSLAPFPFAPPPGAFHRVRRPAGASRAGAPRSRLVACSSPSPDVVVTREHGKNGKLVAALVSSLPIVVVLALVF